ncbi:unannotated protein [freshwater metagenome]|uniref:Unannotated protein n=1 Tax=freshwater metagenome TaxID=449393 RepID=A0A6J6Q5K4_9ZZZZ
MAYSHSMTYGADQVLTGSGNSDYERYIRTNELLSLQKGPDTWEHRDELLFTVVHQSSELWLKLAIAESHEIITRLQAGDIAGALRLVDRIPMCVIHATQNLDMLEKMSPWDYQQVRRALGHGSGFDSPGFNGIRAVIPQLGVEFHRLLRAANISLLDLFVHHEKHDQLYRLAEALIEVDERMINWRHRHFKVVERSIGLHVSGTQGTPVEVIGQLRDKCFFPELWDIRTEITNHALKEE